MKRKQSIITFNYWPGYVDAMFNVVLSVLLIIGLMVVGLLCLNLEVVKSGTAISQINKISEINQINKLNQQKKIEEEQKLLALLGAFLQSQLDRKKDLPATPSQAPAPDTSTVVPSNLYSNMPPRLDWWPVGTSYPLRAAPEEWAFLLSQLKKQNLEGDIELASSRPFALYFGILQFRPNDRQNQELQAHLNDTPKAQSWLVVTGAPANNRTLLESGNWRLTSVRKALEAQGIPASRIQHRLLPMNDPVFTGRVLFVMPVGASS